MQQGVSGQNPGVNQRTIDCFDSNPPMVGYDRIQDIMEDQKDEYDRIAEGLEPRPPYVFRLCPNTEFNSGMGAIAALLDGLMFICGPNLASSDNCVFSGGTQQFLFAASRLEEYSITTVSFVGVTFTKFAAASISADGNAGTTAMFLDCVWRDFNTNFVINMGSAMRVEITKGSRIQNGQGATFFSNDGGTLIFDDVQFQNIRGASAIATSNGGVTMMDRLTFNNGDLDSFAYASGGSAHTVVNTTVSGLTGVNDVFSARNEGTTLMMINTNIRDNKLQAASAFTGVRILDSAMAEVKRSTFTGNTAVSFGFLSRGNANLELIDVDIIDNTGIQGALTAATYVDDDSQLTLRHVVFDGNFVFTAQVFALFAGKADVSMSCFKTGGGDTILFISENSAYTDTGNFMSPDMASTSCRTARDGRLAQENLNSGCFDPQDASPCSIGCERFGRASSCEQTMAPTTTPSAFPTMHPSGGPSTSVTPTGDGNSNGNGPTMLPSGDGNGDRPPLFPTVLPVPTTSTAPSNSLRPSMDPATSTTASMPSSSAMNPALPPFLLSTPAFAPFFLNPAVAPFFSAPAVKPSFNHAAFAPAFAAAIDNPAIAPALIPSLFNSPTCDPALHSPGMNSPMPGLGQGPLSPPFVEPHYHYKPLGYGSSSKKSRKGMRGKKGRGVSKGAMNGTKGAKPPGSGWTHHNGIGEGSPHEQHQKDLHHHHHQHNEQDPNQHHHHPTRQQHVNSPLTQQQQDPLKDFQGHIQQFLAPMHQYSPNHHYHQHPSQQQHYHDPQGGVAAPHWHSQTLYIHNYVEKRVDWGTDHGWNAHTHTGGNLNAARLHRTATSNRKGPHSPKPIGRRRNLNGLRKELEKDSAASRDTQRVERGKALAQKKSEGK